VIALSFQTNQKICGGDGHHDVPAFLCDADLLNESKAMPIQSVCRLLTSDLSTQQWCQLHVQLGIFSPNLKFLSLSVLDLMGPNGTDTR